MTKGLVDVWESFSIITALSATRDNEKLIVRAFEGFKWQASFKEVGLAILSLGNVVA